MTHSVTGEQFVTPVKMLLCLCQFHLAIANFCFMYAYYYIQADRGRIANRAYSAGPHMKPCFTCHLLAHVGAFRIAERRR